MTSLGSRDEQRQRSTAILQRYFRGQTAIQIACDLGVSLYLVRAALHRRGLKSGDNGRNRPGPRGRVDREAPFSEGYLVDRDWDGA